MIPCVRQLWIANGGLHLWKSGAEPRDRLGDIMTPREVSTDIDPNREYGSESVWTRRSESNVRIRKVNSTRLSTVSPDIMEIHKEPKMDSIEFRRTIDPRVQSIEGVV